MADALPRIRLIFSRLCLEEMPFPTQKIQTDRGHEFFVLEAQKRSVKVGDKFRPNKPSSPPSDWESRAVTKD